LAGVSAGANLGLLYIAGTVAWLRDRARARWTQVRLRVVSAWIAAVASLMAALAAFDHSMLAGVPVPVSGAVSVSVSEDIPSVVERESARDGGEPA
jgi:hypothetical protein